MKDLTKEYRVGLRVGGSLWQVKQGPGWKVIHQCNTLLKAAHWLRLNHGADISKVPVLTRPPWKTLLAHIQLRNPRWMIAEVLGLKKGESGICKNCNCTHFTPCIDRHGQACGWTDRTHTLCTACVKGKGMPS